MAFTNPPIDDLFVPSNAGQFLPGGGRVAGIAVTSDIPQAIAAYYSPYTIPSISLYYSDAETTYYYDFQLGTQRVHGAVFNDSSVSEIYREILEGGPGFPAVLSMQGEIRYKNYRPTYVAIATRSAAFPATNAVVPFTSVDRDPGGIMATGVAPATPVTGIITIPVTGVWCVTAKTLLASGPVGGRRSIAIKTNGAFVNGEEFKTPGMPVADPHAMGVVVERVWNAGDVLSVNVFSDVAGASWSDTRVSIKLVSL